jgi:hypothetical protein
MSLHHPKEDSSYSVDFPFDLNNLFNLTYSFDLLKQAIEHLANNQANHAKIISQL